MDIQKLFPHGVNLADSCQDTVEFVDSTMIDKALTHPQGWAEFLEYVCDRTIDSTYEEAYDLLHYVTQGIEVSEEEKDDILKYIWDNDQGDIVKQVVENSNWVTYEVMAKHKFSDEPLPFKINGDFENEVDNNFASYARVHLVAKISAPTFLHMDWDTSHIIFPAGTKVGLYCQMEGAGSLFDCTLAEDFIVPTGEDSDWVVGLSSEFRPYSLDDCYGGFDDAAEIEENYADRLKAI